MSQPKLLPPLTPRQAEVLDFIRTMIAETGVPRSSPEIRDRFRWKWTASAQQTVQALEHKRYVTSEPGVARSIRLIDEPKQERPPS